MEKNTEILIIEDSPTQAVRLEILLAEQGYHVTIAKNGEEGLDLVLKKAFPIVITDWVMPKMSGTEFCQKVRALNLDNYIYIILVTAKEEKADIIDGLKSGADDFLSKPVDPAELLARLETGNRILELEKSLREKHEQILKLLITDPLTGIYNRRYMTEQLPGEIKRTIRYQHPLSIIMADIDHFKGVNDGYGHLAGDRVLEKIAGILGDSVRQNIDWVVRFGGEEFLMVLPETDLSGALTLAEKIRTAIMDTIIFFESHALNVTISLGVAAMEPKTGEEKIEPDHLLSKADQLLYEAKEKGRNKCCGGLI